MSTEIPSAEVVKPGAEIGGSSESQKSAGNATPHGDKESGPIPNREIQPNTILASIPLRDKLDQRSQHHPLRTSSAPPDENAVSLGGKFPAFIPTKTRDSFTLIKESENSSSTIAASRKSEEACISPTTPAHSNSSPSSPSTSLQDTSSPPIQSPVQPADAVTPEARQREEPPNYPAARGGRGYDSSSHHSRQPRAPPQPNRNYPSAPPYIMSPVPPYIQPPGFPPYYPPQSPYLPPGYSMPVQFSPHAMPIDMQQQQFLMHQQHQLQQQQQGIYAHNSSPSRAYSNQPPQPTTPQPRSVERKPVTVKDRHGNLVDMRNLASSNGSTRSPSMSESSASLIIDQPPVIHLPEPANKEEPPAYSKDGDDSSPPLAAVSLAIPPTPSESQAPPPEDEWETSAAEWNPLPAAALTTEPVVGAEAVVSMQQEFDDEDLTPGPRASSPRSGGTGVGKKSLKKMLLSSKDEDSMLAAYETTPPPSVPSTASTSDRNGSPKQPDVVEAKPTRSLRPGGGLGVSKVSVGAGDIKRVYLKAEIVEIVRGFPTVDRPSILSIYDGIEQEGKKTITAPSQPPQQQQQQQQQQDRHWSKQQSQQQQQPYQYQQQQSPYHSGHGQPQGQYPAQSQFPGQQQQQQQHPNYRDREDWKRGREQLPSGQQPQQQQQMGYRNNKKKEPAGPMRKRVIVDPAEKMSREVREILNKITPQTFEKLSAKICDIPIDTNEMLDLMIHEVFEKAVQEPNFANLYADMCSALEAKSACWAFLQIVFVKDSNQYIWMKNVPMDDMLCGPYSSIQDCIAATESVTLPPMRPAPGAMEFHNLFSSGSNFVKIFRLVEKQDELFFSLSSYDDIDPSTKSEKAFPNEEAAKVDAAKKNSFRCRLINACQVDFENAISESGIYDGVKTATKSFKEGESKMSGEERAQAMQDLEFLEIRLKKRIQGVIRFIGELYKKQLVKTSTMFECTKYLLGDEEVGWKIDEQSIELLCKLLRTVGSMLDTKTTANKAKLNALFKRLEELRVEKKLPNRVKFGIQEVMELRLNGWQERRVQEGPATVAEIRQKVAQEEMEQQQMQMQMQQMNKGQQRYPYNNQGPPMRGGAPVQLQGQMQGQRDRGKTDVRVYTSTPAKTVNDQSPRLLTKKISLRPEYVKAENTINAKSAVPPLDESKMRRKVIVIIDEFIATNNIQESFVSLEEDKVRGETLFICLMEKYLNSNRPKEKESMITMLENCIPKFLLQQSQAILSALLSFEPLVALSETVLDVKEAPEAIGKLCGMLIRLKALTLSDVSALIEKHRSNALNDEFSTESQVREVYDKVLHSLRSG